MLVVLPFENLGAPEDEYFADGITEEITSRLAALQGLGVISRTSAFQYKGAGKNIKQIGEELGVGYVLEGTVRWDRATEGESHIRVTPQLIRVSDDTHLWSERYDRKLENIFVVQSQIAERVIDQLDVALLGDEREILTDRPTDNMEAYQAYLRGLEHMNRPGYGEESARAAVQMFERAVALDPNFALAYTGLSRVLSLMYHQYHDRSDTGLAKAKAAVDRALELQPGLPEAHVVLGMYYYWGLREYDLALKELALAERDLPNNAEILATAGFIHRRQGRFETAREKLERAFEISPQDAETAFEVAETCAALRAYDDAIRYCDRAIFLLPDYSLAYVFKVLYTIEGYGDLNKSRAILERMPGGSDLMAMAMWGLQLAYERNYEGLLPLLDSIPVEYIGRPDLVLSKPLLMGQVYQIMGQPEVARAYYDSAQVSLESKVAESPEDHRVRSLLGMAYAGQGRKEDAIREGKQAVDLCPVSKDAIAGALRLEDLAKIFVVVGEYDAALDEIEHLLAIPGGLTSHNLRLDPYFDPLREHPRFRQLLEEH
jgi:TolB-like protein/Tfp pilus assembly protein PilF